MIQYYLSSYSVNQSERLEITIKVNIADLILPSGNPFPDVGQLQEVNLRVTGSWDGWKSKLRMNPVHPNKENPKLFFKKLMLRPGEYQFKYILNGEWMLEKSKPVINDENGISNHPLSVDFFSPEEKSSKIIFGGQKAKWDCILIKDMPNMSLYGHSINMVDDNLYIFGGRRQLGAYRNQMIKIDVKSGKTDLLNTESDYVPEPRGFQK